jgi:hypothetical protein
MRDKLEIEPISMDDIDVKAAPTQNVLQRFQDVVSALISIENEERCMLGAIKIQLRNLKSRKKTIENRIQNTRATLFNAMDICDIEKIEYPVGNVNTSLSPPKLCIEDERALLAKHPEYRIIKDPEVDKKSLLDDVKNGVLIDGVSLQQTKIITIRRK